MAVTITIDEIDNPKSGTIVDTIPSNEANKTKIELAPETIAIKKTGSVLNITTKKDEKNGSELSEVTSQIAIKTSIAIDITAPIIPK